MKPEHINMSSFLRAAVWGNKDSKGGGSDPVALALEINKRLSDTRVSRAEFEAELASLDAELAEFLTSLDSINLKLKGLSAKPKAEAVQPKEITEDRSKLSTGLRFPKISLSQGQPAGMTADDFKTLMEKIVQGSIDSMSDKISGKILSMLKDLKGLAGTARDEKMRQIKEAAADEMVDLSSLYMHEEVQSNLKDVGIEEKESKGIDSSLERLRKMRGLKPKPGDSA